MNLLTPSNPVTTLILWATATTVAAMLTLLVVTLAITVVTTFQADQAEYQAQNDCIHTLVTSGIERRDIIRTPGGCKIIVSK